MLFFIDHFKEQEKNYGPHFGRTKILTYSHSMDWIDDICLFMGKLKFSKSKGHIIMSHTSSERA